MPFYATIHMLHAYKNISKKSVNCKLHKPSEVQRETYPAFVWIHYLLALYILRSSEVTQDK